MSLNVRGILENVSFSTEQPVTLYPFLRQVFVNETPLIARTRREPAENDVYKIVQYGVRPRTYTLAAAITNVATTITLNDSTPLLVGDVLEIISTDGTTLERVEVTDLPSATTATIRRAREGTTAQANDTTGAAASLIVTLIANSRTGAEIDQVASRSLPTSIEQYVQTYQYPVQVGGKVNAIRATKLPGGMGSVFSMEQQVKLTEFMRDQEYSAYYGLGEKTGTAGDRMKQKGLKAQIAQYGPNTNVTANAGASYTQMDFLVDGVAKAKNSGGQPDVALVSSDFMIGLATWTSGAERYPAPRMTQIGVPIQEFTAPMLGNPITFIESPQLKAGTAFVLTSEDVLVRYIRQEFWNPRGNRGDAIEGEWIADTCVELQHPSWHSVITGISSWAKAT